MKNHDRLQKEKIIQKLKERGSRMTRQRLLLLDIILEADCSSCKEIYYKAAKNGVNIGLSTVYRMVNILEEIGAISRKNMYKVLRCEENETEDSFTVEFDDGTTALLSEKSLDQIVCAGLEEYGYLQGRTLRSVKRNN